MNPTRPADPDARACQSRVANDSFLYPERAWGGLGINRRTQHPASTGLPFWKRLFDLGLLLVVMPFVLPVSALLALYVRLISRGPVLFKQDRIGHRCQKFPLLKFRSMQVNANTGVHETHFEQLITGNQPMRKLDTGDDRLIPLGRWIRAAGLDELPQLWNVVRGEMSLVGPRPCTERELRLYSEPQKERFEAVPGLTGLWQVSGKNRTTFAEMIELDIRYARTQSPWLDLKIIFRTVPTIITQLAETRKPPSQLARRKGAGVEPNSVNCRIRSYEKPTEHRGGRIRILGPQSR